MKLVIKCAILALIAIQCSPLSGQEILKGTHKTLKSDSGEKYTGQNFGEKIHHKSIVGIDDVMMKLQKEEEVKATMKAPVSEVCQVKGCWMTLGRKGEMVVKFKDYGFFVPKDISGREVIVEGTAYREVTPVEELRHYAEDAGKSKEEIAAITEAKEELKFMATGVLVLDK